MKEWIGLVAVLTAGGGVDSGLPRSVTVECGDLAVRFESRSFRTLSRGDSRGRRLGTDRFGSHYGNVFHFPGTGFIGSGHTENENEEPLEMSLFLDGKAVANPDPAKRVALYSRPLGCGVLTEIRSEGNVTPRQEDYRDYPDRYRKHYSRVLIGRTLKPGERPEMTLRATPFEAPVDKGQKVAAAI